ncbi:MAG: hypothetical protein N2595_04340 [bacterium]|nr:hypothetical protein [bacterium]
MSKRVRCIWLISVAGWAAVLAARVTEPGGLSPAAVSLLHKGIFHLYNLELDQAEQCFVHAGELASNHPAPYVYLAAVLISRAMCEGGSEDLHNATKRCLQRAITVSTSATAHPSPWAEMYHGAACLLLAQQCGLSGSYLEGMRLLKQATVRIERATHAPDTCADAGVLLGAYQFFAHATPWFARHFAGVLILPPDVRAGLRQLDAGVTDAVMLQPEALMLACLAHAWSGNHLRALELAVTLTNRFPANPQWDLLLQYVLVHLGNYDAALASATTTVLRLETSSQPLVRALLPDQHYWCGVIYAAVSNYPRAVTHFGAAAAFASRKHYLRAWGLLRQGTMHDLLGEREAACACYRAAVGLQHASYSVRAYARQFLQEPYAGQPLE